MRAAARIAVASMAGGFMSVVLFHPAPIYDPAAWMVWAAEIANGGLGLAAGPSWKPLPVIVAAPATLVSWDFAFLSWLWLVRTATIATSVLLWRFAASRGGPAAGAIAAFAPFLIGDWVQLALGGGSEPVLMALALGAVAADRAGLPRAALALGFAAGLLRPEVWLFVGAYGTWLMRREFRRFAPTFAIGAIVEVTCWFALPAIGASDPLQASRHARIHEDDVVPLGTFLERTFEAMPWPIWVLAAAGVALAVAHRDRLLSVMAAAAGAWIGAVGLLTAFGFPGIGRYSLPAMVVLCIHAGTGASGTVRLSARWPAGKVLTSVGLAVLVVIAAGSSFGEASRRFDKVREIDRITAEAHRLIAAAGGMDRLVAECGPLGTNWTYATTLAWRERGSLGRLSRLPEAPGLVLLLEGASSKDQPVPPRRTTGRRIVASRGEWKLVSYSGRSTCRPQRKG